jgi:hypothetical protein
MNEKDQDKVGIPVKYVIPDEIITRYATDMVVQHSDQEFLISFWEIQRPVLLGTDEERKAQVQMIKFIENRCVARFAITPDRMQKFLDALKENVDHYQKEKASKADQ